MTGMAAQLHDGAVRTRRLVACSLLVFSARAAASIAVALPVEDLASRADAVVVGRIVAQEARWNDTHRRIFTRVSVAIDARWLWRPAAGPGDETIVVVRPGGERDGFGQEVFGEPTFTTGERAVLFLVRRGAIFRVVGMAQGVFHLDAGGRAVQDLSGLALVRSQAGTRIVGAHGAGGEPPLRLPDLERRVARGAAR